jgi:hypothetical protein
MTHSQWGRSGSIGCAMHERDLRLGSPIVLFGSAPLQSFLDPQFLSADVDVGVNERGEDLKAIIDELGLTKGQAAFYIEVCDAFSIHNENLTCPGGSVRPIQSAIAASRGPVRAASSLRCRS